MNESKPVVQLSKTGEVIKVFESSAQASQETGVNVKGIRDTLNGVQKTSGGFVWKYADEAPAAPAKKAAKTKNTEPDREDKKHEFRRKVISRNAGQSGQRVSGQTGCYLQRQNDHLRTVETGC